MRHLWQRIFAYSLVLIILSQTAVFLMHTYFVDKGEVKRFIVQHSLSIANAIEGTSLSTANSVAGVFNRKENRVWLEDTNGTVLAGTPSPKGKEITSRLRDRPVDNLTLLEEHSGDIRFVTVTPIILQNGEARLCMTFSPPKRRGMWTFFFQGIVVLSFIGVLLSLWMARRVSRPLRKLRDEVMEISGGSLESRVTVRGRDEITDVAVAINHMTDSLARHISGMRELVANISHEMRSPLARMQVSLAMLEEDIQGENPAASRTKRIGEELAHMNKLIGATLLSSKLDLQGPKLMTATVAFSELCREMCRRQAPLFAEKNIRFTLDIANGITLAGDETLLATLVSNLLDNAAKYTAGERLASFRLQRDADTILLAVENTHTPLPPEVLANIFAPFYRGGIATGSGVGLGLSLVQKIAAVHKGEAWAENTVTGLLVSVRFPCDA